MRILIGIITAHHPTRIPYRLKARHTWLKDCPLDYKFVFGDGIGRWDYWLMDGLHLACPDDRKNMVLKNQGLFRYALDNDYDFCFRVCDDTVVYPDRLLTAGLEAYDYAGAIPAKIRVGPMQVPMKYLDYMNGGCGIWLSRKAMEMLVADQWQGPMRVFPPNLDMGFGLKLTLDNIDWDDRWIGEVLKGNLAWDDPKRDSPYLAYALNGINVLEDEMMFYHSDEKRHITEHDPGVDKEPSIISKQEMEARNGA